MGHQEDTKGDTGGTPGGGSSSSVRGLGEAVAAGATDRPQAMLLQCGLYCRRMVVRLGSLTVFIPIKTPLLHWVVGVTQNAYLNVLHEVLLNVLLELW